MPSRPRRISLSEHVALLEERLRSVSSVGLVLAGSTQIITTVEKGINPSPESWLGDASSGFELVAGIYDVTRYGAPDDDSLDAAPAIQNACDDAEANGGGIVFLPRKRGGGRYFINSPITWAAGVHVLGGGWGDQVFDEGTVLFVRDTSFTPLTLGGRAASLRNIQITHDQPPPGGGWTPNAYPYTVNVRADDCLVENVLFLNPTNGIRVANDADTAIGIGRVVLRRIFGQPFDVGISFERCLDVCYTDLVHFWPFWSSNSNVLGYTFANADAIESGRNDNPMFAKIFSLAYRRQFRFFETTGTVLDGPTKKFKITDADADACATGIYVEGDETTGQASGLTHHGDAALGTSVAGIHVDADDCYVAAHNVRSTSSSQHGVRVEGASNFIQLDNLWVENWNQAAGAHIGVHIGAGNTAQVGFQRRFTGGGGAAQTGGGGTVNLDV